MIPKTELQRQQLALWHRRADPNAVVAMLETLEPAMKRLSFYFNMISGMDPDDLQTECIAAFLRYLHAWNPDGNKTFFGFYFERMRWQLMAYTKKTQAMIKVPMREWSKGVRAAKVLSLDAPRRGAEGEARSTLADLIPDGKPSVFDDIADRDEVERLHAALKTMSARHRFIIERRLDGLTLEQIGERLELTRERVRQIEEEALHRLRRKIRATAAVKRYAPAAQRYIPRAAAPAQPTAVPQEEPRAASVQVRPPLVIPAALMSTPAPRTNTLMM